MESEDSYMKCDPLIPRQGKKILCVLVTVNIIIIWLLCTKSNYITYFYPNSVHVVTNSVYAPLYNIPIFHIPLLYTKDMAPYYTEVSSSVWCLHEGIDLKESKNYKKCICQTNWFGLDCGIPLSVWKSDFMKEGKNAGIEIRRRDKPRRIILSVVFDEGFDLLDINIRNLFTVVDLILVAEEKEKTNSASRKFKEGYLSEFQSKIMPIKVRKVEHNVTEKDRIASMLEELWLIEWKKLSDFRLDDILVFSHMTSIISKEVMLFLKLYDGYPALFSFSLRPVLFKFSNILKSSNTNYILVPFEPLGCTLKFISTICDYSVHKFIQTKCMENKLNQRSFEKQRWMLKQWTVGNAEFPSGWQCNFCCDTKCVMENIKMHRCLQNITNSLSLNLEHLNASVIEKFLNKKSYHGNDIAYERIPNSDFFFAPRVIINSEKYAYLF